MRQVHFETQDYAIGGKMVVGTATMDEDAFELMRGGDFSAKQKLKQELIHQMAEFMLENNLVEFTQQKSYSPNTYMPVMHVKVRAYIAPNDQVKILRTIAKPL